VADGRDRRCQGAVADAGPARVTGAFDGRLTLSRLAGGYGTGATMDDEGRTGGRAAQ